jgi:hypothetical protein
MRKNSLEPALAKGRYTSRCRSSSSEAWADAVRAFSISALLTCREKHTTHLFGEGSTDS